ncbi:hypothetical protein WISP_52666 [Willisornis vidua]|uniref:Uncharacterized protein n=1 Tax=Willisornis vidua TaxID=1566151 RepID=A0ABQ9DJ36_9PASS|nr:hypothetical protein WISP_52666 [Willisornis vidua]
MVSLSSSTFLPPTPIQTDSKSFSRFNPVPNGSNWTKLCLTSSNRINHFKLDLTRTERIKLDPINSNQIKTVQSRSNWIKLVQIRPNQFKMVPTGSNLFKMVKTGSNQVKLIKLVQNGFNWFKPDPVNLITQIRIFTAQIERSGVLG